MVRTRFAPSPTGDLHVGGAWTALAAWAVARASGGRTVLRVEDLDTPRVVLGSRARIEDDLAWLGLDWDEGPPPLGVEGAGSGPHAPYVQSLRGARYEEALDRLLRDGLVYPCDCSRAEIARVASAPHAGEELVYPGVCRDKDPKRVFKRDPALRLRVPDGAIVSFDDRLRGPVEQDVARTVGDFVLRRGDGVFAYQLACAVDDALMQIDLVVRGDDLLASTPRQLLLMRLLEMPHAPAYAHVPLVVAPSGERLAKRSPGATVRDLRAHGTRVEDVIGELARGLGLTTHRGPLAASDVAAALEPTARWRTVPWPIPDRWAAPSAKAERRADDDAGYAHEDPEEDPRT
jgi:glutamyl-tRNA synthetase